MTYRVSLADLAAMSEEEQNAELDQLARYVQDWGEAGTRTLDARIRRFEQEFGLSSAEMVERVKSGAMRETAEVAQWLFYLDTRENRVTG